MGFLRPSYIVFQMPGLILHVFKTIILNVIQLMELKL